MNVPVTRYDTAAAADPTPCAECGGSGFDPICDGHPTPGGRVWCECERCDPAAVDDCRPGDDVAESAPDDASRWAHVARYHAA